MTIPRTTTSRLPLRSRVWAPVPAVVAPVALIGGWSLAAAVQPGGFSSVRQTISALAATGTPHREIMTIGLVLLGLGHLGTAWALTPARPPGRWLLGLGGLGTLAVAAFPQPDHGTSAAHTASAALAFVALALWPAFGSRRGEQPVLRWSVSIAATVVLVGLLAVFYLTISGSVVGATERVLAGAEALWPLVVVLGTRRRPRRAVS